jgi:hypothetical protein
MQHNAATTALRLEYEIPPVFITPQALDRSELLNAEWYFQTDNRARKPDRGGL